MRYHICLLFCLLPHFVLAADIIWEPSANAVPQIETSVAGGTGYATGETVSAQIDNAIVTVTLGTDVATADVVEALGRAINADTATDDLANDETRNVGGQSLPEFTEVVASWSGSTLTVQSATAGVPFDIVFSETSTNGTLGAGTIDQQATGPLYADNTDNWRGGALPGDGDRAVFNFGAIGPQYGLTAALDGTDKVSLLVTTDFTGPLGLPPIRTTPTGATYIEYRNRYWKTYSNDGSVVLTFQAGKNGGAQAAKYIDLTGQSVAAFRVEDGGTVGATPTIVLKGGTVGETSIVKGYVELDPNYDPPTTAGIHDDITVGTRTTGASATKLVIGPTVHSNDADGYIQLAAGTIINYAPLVVTSSDRYRVETKGQFDQVAFGDLYYVIIFNGGVFSWIGGGETSQDIFIYSGGTLDLALAHPSITWNNNIIMYYDSTFYAGLETIDFGSVGNYITVTGCSKNDVHVIRKYDAP